MPNFMPETSTLTISGAAGISGTYFAGELASPRAVELKDCWVGQIVVRGRIVRERDGFKSYEKAQKWARKHIDICIINLFA